LYKISAHEAPLYTVTQTKLGFLTGSKNGEIKLFSPDFKVLYTYKTGTFYPKPNSLSVHSVATNKSGTSFVCGMKSGEIFEISLASHTHSILVESHSSGG
jgi:hypothetical protein